GEGARLSKLAHNSVGAGVWPRRHAFVGDVWDLVEQLLELLVERASLRAERLELIADLTSFLDQLGRSPLRIGHQLAELIATLPKTFFGPNDLSTSEVGFEQLVERRRLTSIPKGLAHEVEVVSDKIQVKHRWAAILEIDSPGRGGSEAAGRESR